MLQRQKHIRLKRFNPFWWPSALRCSPQMQQRMTLFLPATLAASEAALAPVFAADAAASETYSPRKDSISFDCLVCSVVHRRCNNEWLYSYLQLSLRQKPLWHQFSLPMPQRQKRIRLEKSNQFLLLSMLRCSPQIQHWTSLCLPATFAASEATLAPSDASFAPVFAPSETVLTTASLMCPAASTTLSFTCVAPSTTVSVTVFCFPSAVDK